MDLDDAPTNATDLLVCTSATRLAAASPTQDVLSESIVNESGANRAISLAERNEIKGRGGRKRNIHGEPILPRVSEHGAARYLKDPAEAKRDEEKRSKAQAKADALFSPSVREKSRGSRKLKDVQPKRDLPFAAVLAPVVGNENVCEDDKDPKVEKEECEPELPDIDAKYRNDHLQCTEYIVDIYKWYKEYELQLLVDPDFMKDQVEIDPAMRKVAINWIIEAHHCMRLKSETLFLAVSYMDRYMAKAQVPKKDLQLLAGTSLFLAAKYEEMVAPSTRDIREMMQSKHKSEDILEMERQLFIVLDGWFWAATPTIFLRRHVRAVEFEDKPEMLMFCEFLSELSLYDYELAQVRPSEVSAAAVLLARATFQEMPLFPYPLQAHSECKFEEVYPVAVKLAELARTFQKITNSAGRRHYVVEKFSTARRFCVSQKTIPSL